MLDLKRILFPFNRRILRLTVFVPWIFVDGLAHANSLLGKHYHPTTLILYSKHNNIQIMDYWLRLLIEIYALPHFKTKPLKANMKKTSNCMQNDDTIINFH